MAGASRRRASSALRIFLVASAQHPRSGAAFVLMPPGSSLHASCQFDSIIAPHCRAPKRGSSTAQSLWLRPRTAASGALPARRVDSEERWQRRLLALGMMTSGAEVGEAAPYAAVKDYDGTIVETISGADTTLEVGNDASDGATETPSNTERKRRRGSKPKLSGPRRTGDVVEEGFTGTRMGFHVVKEYEVPQVAPTDLPDGEEEGYPMLLYQFMHAQYRDDYPSQSSARKAVRRKELLLNGEEVRNDVKVKPGYAVTLQKRVQPGLFPQGKPTCTLPVVWEDDYMAVIIKPPGVAVHGGTGEDDPGPGGRQSVRQALPYMLKPTKSEDRPLHRPLHCHRLDKRTGGLLICAKTRPALSAISDAFERRLVSKKYVALVGGTLEGSGAIVTPLDGKASMTNFRVRGSPVRSLKTPFITTVDLWPVTGRFHQLRRHLASIGCPILGDKRYTPEDVPLQQGGMFLQAVGLTFPHPITGEEMHFSIPEPAKFGRWREKENERWLEHHNDGVTSSDEEVSEEASKNRSPNAIPEVEGLEIRERDGFRYYQYDWSAVGGLPAHLSFDDIDDTVEDP